MVEDGKGLKRRKSDKRGLKRTKEEKRSTFLFYSNDKERNKEKEVQRHNKKTCIMNGEKGREERHQ